MRQMDIVNPSEIYHRSYKKYKKDLKKNATYMKDIIEEKELQNLHRRGGTAPPL